jgi:hypothetical protein
MTITVTYNDKRGEPHIAAALYNLGDALDGNDSVFETVFIFVDSFILVLSHEYSPSS